MKKLLLLILALAAFNTQAIDRITATITATNTPADGNTFTVNGDVRTWKTTVTTPATQISITNVTGYTATNLFNHAAANLYGGPLNLSYSSTNGIKLIARSGNALVVTASGTWCTITMSTQLVTGLTIVRTPVSGEPTATVRTNIASDLAEAISDYSTNAIAAGAYVMTNFDSLSGAQTITGAKRFTGATILSNDTQLISGGVVSNVTAYGDGHGLTNLHIQSNFQFTNAANIFTASVSGPSLLFSSADTPIYGGFAIYDSDGNSFLSMFASAEPITFYKNILLVSCTVTGAFAGDGLLLTNLNSNVPLLTGTNTWTGTNKFAGTLAFTRRSNSSLATGGNAGIDTSTNVNFSISGPGAAFSTDGFNGGTDGRFIHVVYRGGFAWSIPHESGTEPTPANRTTTSTAATVTLTGNPAWADFWYDTSVNRWVLAGHSN